MAARQYKFGAAALAALVFMTVNLAANQFLSHVRIDLTQHGLYTLTDGSRAILSDLNEPVVLRLFISRSELVRLSGVASYAARVEDLLSEYERLSGGGIDLRIIEPEPFSEQEDRAVSYGIQGFPVGQGDTLGYFGLAGTNLRDERQVIPFLSPEHEHFLEYELTRMVYRLSNPERKVVGIISSLPIQGLPDASSQLAGASPQPWFFLQQLQELFEVRVLRPAGEGLPKDLDVLVLAHPKNLSDADIYDIEQFALSGKSLLILVDPHSEVNAALLRNVPQLASSSTSSTLNVLTAQWGVELAGDQIVADLASAARVLDPQGETGQTIEYPVWMNVQPGQLAQADVVTANLGNLVLASAGVLELGAVEGLSVEPLIVTTPASMLYPHEEGSRIDDIRSLLGDYASDGLQHVMAARISGRVSDTAFPAGRPESSGGGLANSRERLSAGHVNAIVIADTDFLQDHFWVQRQQLGSSVITVATASNGKLIENAIDNLAGNEALISVRSRGGYFRPFERLQRIRARAEQQFLRREHELVEQLGRIDQLVGELTQSQGEGQAGIILTDQQREEFEQAREERLRLRNELREVRRSLREDIERISSIIKFVNVALVPGLVAMAGTLFGIFGFRRRDRALADEIVEMAR